MHFASKNTTGIVLASAGHRTFLFKSAVHNSATEFQFSSSATASPQLHVQKLSPQPRVRNDVSRFLNPQPQVRNFVILEVCNRNFVIFEVVTSSPKLVMNRVEEFCNQSCHDVICSELTSKHKSKVVTCGKYSKLMVDTFHAIKEITHNR